MSIKFKRGASGKPIDLTEGKFRPFKNYRLTESTKAALENHFQEEKLSLLVATLEYLGSRKLEEINQRASLGGLSLLSTQINKSWFLEGKEPDCLPLSEICNELSTHHFLVNNQPIFAKTTDESNTVSLLLSSECFEINTDGPEQQLIQ